MKNLILGMVVLGSLSSFAAKDLPTGESVEIKAVNTSCEDGFFPYLDIEHATKFNKAKVSSLCKPIACHVRYSGTTLEGSYTLWIDTFNQGQNRKLVSRKKYSKKNAIAEAEIMKDNKECSKVIVHTARDKDYLEFFYK